MSANGAGQKRLVGGDDPNWTPSGEFIIHSTGQASRPALGIVRPDGKDARILFTVNACRALQSSWFREHMMLKPNNGKQRTALRAAADAERVCRAWHVTMSVEVRQPGFRRAEG
jgi:hypothetical protein